MGSSEKFRLRWSDFEANVSRSFAGIRDHSQFFDCTLTTDDDEAYSDNLRAHKVILSACSEFFKNILTKESMCAHPNPLIYLGGISSRDMKYILDFMYHGEVHVAQEELDKFLEVAETLKIKGLNQESNGSKASKRPASPNASSPPLPVDPLKNTRMHSATTPPLCDSKAEAEVAVKTESGPSGPVVGTEDFVEDVGGGDDYGGGHDDYGHGQEFDEGEDKGEDGGKSGGTDSVPKGRVKGGVSGRVMYGEAERQTLLNLIQAIDKDQVLLSIRKTGPIQSAKHEIWKQVTDSFNDITGSNASVLKLHKLLLRMKKNRLKCRRYFEYDKDLDKWIIL